MGNNSNFDKMHPPTKNFAPPYSKSAPPNCKLIFTFYLQLLILQIFVV